MKFLVLVFAFISLPLHARWQTAKEAGAVLELLRIEHEVHKDGTEDQYWLYVVRVQSEDGKAAANIFNVDYNGLTEKVEIQDAYTLNGKEKIRVEPSAIEDRDKGESKEYDAMKVRSVVFPQVQVGSKIYLKYKIQTTKPLIKDQWSAVVTMSPGFWIERLEVKVKSERPLVAEVIDPRGWVKIKQQDKHVIEVTNAKPIPGGVHAEKDPFFHPSGDSHVWVSTSDKWDQFFAGTTHEYEQILDQPVPSALKPWVKAAGRKKTAEEKILFYMEKMSHDFRYFGDWRRHDGGFVPRSLAEIEKGRYGDCKDLSALLTSLLRAVKVDANVAFVRRGQNPWLHEPDYKTPSSYHFNHAVVRARVGDKSYWLDPTNPVASLMPYNDIAGRPAFIVANAGGGMDRLPDIKSDQFQSEMIYQYHFLGDDDVKVRVDANLRKFAPFETANELMLESRSKLLSGTLEYLSEGRELKSYKFIKEPETGRVLKDMDIVLEYVSGRLTFNAGKSSFFVFSDGIFSGAFYETDDRESDLELNQQPVQFKMIRRLKDTRLAQAAPENCRIEASWLSMDREIKVEGKDLVIVQNLDLRRPFITRAEFRSPEFKKLQKETKRCFYRSGLLIEANKGALRL